MWLMMWLLFLESTIIKITLDSWCATFGTHRYRWWNFCSTCTTLHCESRSRATWTIRYQSEVSISCFCVHAKMENFGFRGCVLRVKLQCGHHACRTAWCPRTVSIMAKSTIARLWTIRRNRRFYCYRLPCRRVHCLMMCYSHIQYIFGWHKTTW